MRSAAGQKLGLALVVVLLASVVGLSASQAFINKTGKTVSGITITFSKDVRITRHDSVFRDQSPSGRSDEFTFDGGELRNSGRFTVTWMPSSAKVTDYEWIEKAQPSQATHGDSPSAEQEFKLPDANTPAILYGDDYLGPDEPLYQPQPDEQIWFTDLEGHGDIYDNDSIRINYAPGFDVSQITKIDVYRNGIKLRFVPEKFNVLTNAQMKTFDGNPAEHIPASSHTDHAIMGYEYKFKILSANHVWILSKTVKSGFHWRPKEIWAEIDNAWEFPMESVSYADMVQGFKILKASGFTGISFPISYYLMTPAGNIFELQESDPAISWWDIRTPPLSAMDTLLKAIKEAGLHAKAMSMFYINKTYSDVHPGTWKGMIDPSDPQLFFETYAKLLLNVIPLLNKYQVMSFTILDEIDTVYLKYPKLVEKLLSDLSHRFNGTVAIDVSPDLAISYDRGDMDEVGLRKMIDEMSFFGWHSEVGSPLNIEYSCTQQPLENQRDQRLSHITQRVFELWNPVFVNTHLLYPRNPVSFGEMVAYVGDGSALGFSFYDLPDKRLDHQEMSDIWYAYFKGAHDLNAESVNVWGIFSLGDCCYNDVPTVGYINIGLRHPESPAYRIIKAIIGPAASASE